MPPRTGSAIDRSPFYGMSEADVSRSALDDVRRSTVLELYGPNITNVAAYNADMNIKIKAMKVLTTVLRSRETLPHVTLCRC
jgi:hypothetical protein